MDSRWMFVAMERPYRLLVSGDVVLGQEDVRWMVSVSGPHEQAERDERASQWVLWLTRGEERKGPIVVPGDALVRVLVPLASIDDAAQVEAERIVKDLLGGKA